MENGQLVKFVEPIDDDEDQIFVVLEMRGDRALFGCVNSGLAIAPTYVYPVADLAPCEF